MDCRRCGGSGKLVVKTGKPDPSRDYHTPYTGLWCYSKGQCPVCYGGGVERDKPNLMAGMRVHFNADGYIIKKENINDDKPTG